MVVKLFATTLLLVELSSASALTLSEAVEKNRQSVIFVKVSKANETTGAVTEQHGTGFILNKEGYAVSGRGSWGRRQPGRRTRANGNPF
jgi:hypothetical protein